jgi:hypothetical protein
VGHDHNHGDGKEYYLDQLCTIGLTGAIGGVCIMLYQQNVLRLMLAPAFFLPVLIGGIALVALAVVRGVFLWIEVGKKPAAHSHGPDCHHDHAHEHAESCHDHSHDDHTHEHAHTHGGADDHGHEHGWTPIRYAVLLLPVMLYLLDLPNTGFSSERAASESSGLQLENTAIASVADRGEVTLGFKELDRAAFLEDQREFFEGKTGVLKGQFVPGSDPRTGRLVRFKMQCCAADAIALKVQLVAAEPFDEVRPPLKPGQWVKVAGQIQFRKNTASEFVPVLQLRSLKDIEPIEPETNPYLP